MYTAIIIEPRCHYALSYVLENFVKNLSDEWDIIVFHGTKNIDFINNILNKKLKKYRDRFTLVKMNLSNMNIQNYNDLFYGKILIDKKTIYDYIPTETFLVFQTDTLILNKNLLNQFLKYDYVGAPWNLKNKTKVDNQHKNINEYNRIGNGGLSLRKKSKMLEILEKNKKIKDGINEDVYFCCPTNVSIYKPSFKKAKLFSVETVFSKKSFGCHKAWNYNDEGTYFKLYPEVKKLYELNKKYNKTHKHPRDNLKKVNKTLKNKK
jgi:hypothetical protein